MGIVNKIKFLWRTSRELNQKIEEIHPGQNLSYRHTITMFSDLLICHLVLKASPENYMCFSFYEKRYKVRKGYLTDSSANKISYKLNNDNVRQIIGHKNETLHFFNSFINRKWLFLNSETPITEIENFVQTVPVFLIKPIDGSMGQGISKQQGLDVLLKIRNEGNFVIEEILENHPKLAAFNKSSLNTLRVITCIDGNGDLHILNIGLRVGMKGSVCDNVHSGGVCYPVDVKSGRISGYGISGDGTHYWVHPFTNLFMLGCEIPMFDKVIEYVKTLSNFFPEGKWIGWDIAITPNAVELIEANSAPGPISMQIDGGKKFQVLKWL